MSQPPSPDTQTATAPAPICPAEVTPATAHLSTVRPWMSPSDPRPGILPPGCAGWPVRGDQEREAVRDLVFVTGPNHASKVSTWILMAPEPMLAGSRRHLDEQAVSGVRLVERSQRLLAQRLLQRVAQALGDVRVGGLKFFDDAVPAPVVTQRERIHRSALPRGEHACGIVSQPQRWNETVESEAAPGPKRRRRLRGETARPRANLSPHRGYDFTSGICRVPDWPRSAVNRTYPHLRRGVSRRIVVLV
jgi:hypothetical protein